MLNIHQARRRETPAARSLALTFHREAAKGLKVTVRHRRDGSSHISMKQLKHMSCWKKTQQQDWPLGACSDMSFILTPVEVCVGWDRPKWSICSSKWHRT